MCNIVLILLLLVQSICFFAREQIVNVFTTDSEVAELADSCVYIIVIAFFPDMIQGSMQGVIRALNAQ